jgi:hypothetical protein
MHSLKSRPRSFFRPSLEGLEDRVQPSVSVLQQPLTLVPNQAAVQAPIAVAPIPVVSPEIDLLPGSQGGGINTQDVNYATYVTGTTNSASSEGVFVDSAGNQWVVGNVVVTHADGTTSTDGFIAKYLPNSTMYDPSFNAGAPLVFRLNFGSLGIYDFDIHGIAIDTDPSHGFLDVVGSALNTTTHNQLAVILVIDPTSLSFVAGAGYGVVPGTDPNSFTGVAVDGLGDAVFTGSLYAANNDPGVSYVAFGVVSDSDPGTPSVFYYDFTQATPPLSSTAGLGIAFDQNAHFIYLSGYVTSADTGSQKLGFGGQIDASNPNFPISITYFTDPSGGDIVFSGAAVNNSTEDSYFSGTGIADGGGDNGPYAAILHFDPTFTYDPNTSVAFQLQDQNGNTIDVSLSGIGVDSLGDVYVVGTVIDPNSPTTPGAFVTAFDPTLQNNAGIGQFGGSNAEHGNALAVTGVGQVVVVGDTTSPDFPVSDGTTLNGTEDGFMLNFSF